MEEDIDSIWIQSEEISSSSSSSSSSSFGSSIEGSFSRMPRGQKENKYSPRPARNAPIAPFEEESASSFPVELWCVLRHRCGGKGFLFSFFFFLFSFFLIHVFFFYFFFFNSCFLFLFSFFLFFSFFLIGFLFAVREFKLDLDGSMKQATFVLLKDHVFYRFDFLFEKFFSSFFSFS